MPTQKCRQWKPFLAYYAGLWTMQNFVRPLRLSLGTCCWVGGRRPLLAVRGAELLSGKVILGTAITHTRRTTHAAPCSPPTHARTRAAIALAPAFDRLLTAIAARTGGKRSAFAVVLVCLAVLTCTGMFGAITLFGGFSPKPVAAAAGA